MKNACDLALELELEGKQYYLNQADSTDDVELKKLFQMLADDEQKHYDIVKQMKDNNSGASVHVTDKAVAQAKKIFSDKVKAGFTFKTEVNRLEAYEHAIQKEIETCKLYTDLVEQAKTDAEKRLFSRLAKEERGHQIILENLTVLIRHPYDWVESAEFGRMEEY